VDKISRKNKFLIITALFIVIIAGIFIIEFKKDNRTGSESLRIIFESGRNVPNNAKYPQKYIELYTMNPDGSNVKRITNNLYWEHKPQVSPDGQKILLTIHFSPENVSETDPSWEIATMNMDGTNLTKLTDNNYLDTDARWNSDGTKIVYVSDSNHRTRDDLKNGLLPQYDIYLMNPDGTGKTRLTFGEPGEVNADPCFSSEGNIYYVHSEGYSNAFDLWRMHEDGSEKSLVFAHSDLIKAINDPFFSYTCNRIIFEGKISEGSGRQMYNLFTVDSTGTNLTRITYNDGESDIWPSFSPDGTYIVYFTYEWDADGGHTQKIRVSKSDGSGEREISTFPWESFPSWFEK